MCAVDGCERGILAKGFCGKHYQRNLKYGDPLASVHVTPEMSLEDRLLHHGWTVTPSGCWEWSGSRFPKGYGRIVLNDVSEGGYIVFRTRFLLGRFLTANWYDTRATTHPA